MASQFSDFIESRKAKYYKRKLQNNLKAAIYSLDIRRINYLIEEGASIKELEENSSVINMALSAAENKIWDELYTKGYNGRYSFKEYLSASYDEMPKEWQIFTDLNNKKLLDVLEVLYKLGAKINYLKNYDSDFSKKETIIDYLSDISIFKTTNLIKWLLSKHDFEPENGKIILYNLLISRDEESIDLLDLAINVGVDINCIIEELAKNPNYLLEFDIPYARAKMAVIYKHTVKDAVSGEKTL